MTSKAQMNSIIMQMQENLGARSCSRGLAVGCWCVSRSERAYALSVVYPPRVVVPWRDRSTLTVSG